MTHPTQDQLLGYADGSLSAGMSLLVASHLTFCPACRDRVARLETLGGAFLAGAPVGALSPPSLEATLARLADPTPAPAAAGGGDPALPQPLRDIVGCRCDEIDWRDLLPGLAEHRLPGFSGEDVSLLRASPGTCTRAHARAEAEATLVLAGQLRDGGRLHGQGDVALAGWAHDREIVGAKTCLCLVVQSAEMRVTQSLGRALDALTS